MVFSSQLQSQNFGHLLSLACLEDWAWYNGVPFSIVDLDNPDALLDASPDESFIIGPGSLLFAPWVPALSNLEAIQQQRSFAWYTGLVPEFVHSEETRAFLRRALAVAGPVAVRWTQEALWLREQCGYPDAVVGSDPALLAPCRVDALQHGRVLFALNGYDLEADWKQALVVQVKDLARRLAQRGLEVDFLAGEPRDCRVGAELLGQAPTESFPLDLEDRCLQIESASLVVSERLHPLLYAASQHVPFVALSYHPKIDQFAAALNMTEQTVGVKHDTPSADTLERLVDRALESSGRLRERLSHECALQRQRVRHALSVLCGGDSGPRRSRRATVSKRSRIAHILAVRNESRYLGGLLERTRPYVDEILVWDDCSTDDTVSIARGLADRVFTSERPAYSCEYGFMSVQAEATSEWILIISPDEEPEDRLLHALPELVKDEAVDGYTFEVVVRDPTGDTPDGPKLRLFRRSSARWWAVPHVSPEIGGRIVGTDMKLYHLRDRTQEETREEASKHLRCLRVLRRAFREVWEPRDERALETRDLCHRMRDKYYPEYSPRSALVVFRAPGSSMEVADEVREGMRQALGNAWRVLDWEEAKETPSQNPVLEADALAIIGADGESPVWEEIRRESHRLFIPIVPVDCMLPDEMTQYLQQHNRLAIRVPAVEQLLNG